MGSMNHQSQARLAEAKSVGRASNHPVIFNIGEVLAQLLEDFPSVTASKIRFYEEKGLINPQRTQAGYRQFKPADVERLRFVLALQRDHYLPLKVIRDYLDAIDEGRTPENLPPGVSIAPKMITSVDSTHLAARRRISASQLCEESGCAPELFEAMLSFGLLSAKDGRFDEHALKIAKVCTELSRHGLEPRHLRPFVVAAEREFGLVERAVTPLTSRRDGTSAERAVEAAREIADLCIGLHSSLMQSHISEMEAR